MQKVVVEFGDSAGRNMMLRACGKMVVRGRFAVSERGDGEMPGPMLGDVMSSVPPVPGAYCEVDFDERRLRIYDPLSSDTERLDRINHRLSSVLVGKGYKPFPEHVEKMQGDEFVTAVAELQRMEANNSLRVLSGSWPAASDLKKIGRTLNDAGASNRIGPRYADEAVAYAAKVDQLT
jgi:hypothetical protein